MTPDPTAPADIAWGRALLAGAVLGGLGWGWFAAATIGSPGDQAHLDAVFRSALAVAGIVTVIGVGIAAALVGASRRTALQSRSRLLRSAAAALVIAAVSGWIVVGLQVFHAFLIGSG